METIKFVWYPEQGCETEVIKILKSEGAKIRSGLGFEPISTIATALALSSLISALIKLYRDARYKGVLINTTTDPIEIREMPSWSRKQVLVITENGAQFIKADDKISAVQELEKIASIIGKQ